MWTCATCWDRRGRSRASEKDGGGGLFCGYLRGGHVLTMIVVCATNRDAGGTFAGCVRARHARAGLTAVGDTESSWIADGAWWTDRSPAERAGREEPRHDRR